MLRRKPALMTVMSGWHSRRRRRSRRPIGETGMTLLELLVSLAIITTVGVVAMPDLSNNDLKLDSAVQQFVGELRMARAGASSRGAHFRVTLAAASYTIQRLQDTNDDGVWEADMRFPAGSMDLPAHISFNVTNGDGIIEFTSRGLVVPRPDDGVAEIERITLSDTAHGLAKQIEVWPSGQVQEV